MRHRKGLHACVRHEVDIDDILSGLPPELFTIDLSDLVSEAIQDMENPSFEVEAYFSPVVPGRYSGPPEKCHPEEGGELESMTHDPLTPCFFPHVQAMRERIIEEVDDRMRKLLHALVVAEEKHLGSDDFEKKLWESATEPDND